MIIKKFSKQQVYWGGSYQNLILLSFIPQLKKIEKQTHLFINQISI